MDTPWAENQIIEALRRQTPARLPRIQTKHYQALIWTEEMSPQEEKLLSQILQAAKISENQVKVLHTKGSLCEEASLGIIFGGIIFGAIDLGLHPQKAVNTLIKTVSLQELLTHPAEKKKLWQALKDWMS